MSHRTVVTTTMFVIIATALMGCGTEPAPTAEPPAAPVIELQVSGSGTTTSILSRIKPAFETNAQNCSLNVLPGTGTGGGVEGILQGTLDAAAMARPPKDDEASQGVEYIEFGQSGVALYTHPDVSVTNLTKAQVVAILLGEFTNWSQVGGPNLDIILYVRDEGDSSTKALRQVVLDDAAFPETAQVLTSQSDMQSAVAGTPGSIGFGSWPSAVAAGAAVQAVALDGVAPVDPAYPMVSPVGIGWLRDHQADVQPLIDWLLSEQGQMATGELGVIAVSSQ
jgi:phosphate transport system substrate-binding protein